VRSLAQLVKVGYEGFVHQSTVDAFGGGEQQFDDGCKPDQVIALGRIAVHCATAIPHVTKNHSAQICFAWTLTGHSKYMSPREERAIRNEALLREVNSHIAEMEEQAHRTDWDEPLPLVCECAQTGCRAPIEVAPATFERVRAEPLCFLVAPGHEQPETETVVERREGYFIVEKHP
jgi:hypothetical protein